MDMLVNKHFFWAFSRLTEINDCYTEKKKWTLSEVFDYYIGVIPFMIQAEELPRASESCISVSKCANVLDFCT